MKEGWVAGLLDSVLSLDSDVFIKLTLAVHFYHVLLNSGILIHLGIVREILIVSETMWVPADSRLCIVMKFIEVLLIQLHLLLRAIIIRLNFDWPAQSFFILILFGYVI